MLLSLTFWLSLLLPGYALARLVEREETECGLLGVIGLAYFWAFALLSPVSILCYFTGAPVSVFSAACVVAVLAGAVVIVLRGWWRELGRIVAAGVGVELLLVIVDLVFGGRTGAFLSGDGEIHVARIRFLLDHGFSNQSPFVDAPAFFSLYHTNLLHALYAACAQLTGIDYLTVWSASLVWGKLAVAGGCYYLAWTVLRNRWAAWLPTLFLAATFSPTPFIIYPNKLAPLFLLPIMLAAGINACRRPMPRSAPMTLAAGSWVLGQVHGLYAIFAGLVLAPVFGALLAARLWRRTGERKLLGWCLAGLVVGAPFVLVARYGGERPERDEASRTAETRLVKQSAERFHESEDGRISLKFSEFLGGQASVRMPLMAVGLIGLALLGRRVDAVVLSGAMGVVLAVLFVPAFCTGLVDLLGARWVILRIGPIAGLIIVVVACGALGLLVTRLAPPWWLRGPVSLATASVAAFLVLRHFEFAVSPLAYCIGIAVVAIVAALLAERLSRRQWVPPVVLIAGGLILLMLTWSAGGGWHVAACLSVLFGGIALQERLRPASWGVPALCMLAVALAIELRWDGGNRHWQGHIAGVSATAKRRGAWLKGLHARQEFYRDNIPAGWVVLAHPRDGRAMVMLHNCFIVMPDRGGGVGLTLPERRRDVNTLIARKTPWEERKALLQKYGIDQVLITRRLARAMDWVREHGSGKRDGAGLVLVDLNVN